MTKVLSAYSADDEILLRRHLVTEAFTLRRELDRIPLANELMPGRRFSQTPYAVVFGTYDAFCKEMAFDFFKFSQSTTLTKEQLIKIIKKVSRVLGITPTIKQFELISGVERTVFKKHFRSFSRGIAAADPDVKRSRSTHFTNERLLQILKNIGRKKNRTPTKTDVRALRIPSLRIYKLRFRSFRKALIAAEFKLPKKKKQTGSHTKQKARLKKLLKEFD